MTELLPEEIACHMAYAANKVNPTKRNKARWAWACGQATTARAKATQSVKIAKAGTSSGWGGK
jgi:hypothetical protein